jgi:hypothetical protein
VEKERYIFSKKLFDRYDGHNVWFRVTEEQYKNTKENKIEKFKIVSRFDSIFVTG